MKRSFIIISLLFAVFFCSSHTRAENAASKPSISYKTELNISYRKKPLRSEDDYIQERCRLDLYYPSKKTGFATVVWFHGGGLTEGERSIPEPFKNQNIAVIAANYRLYPKVTCPVYIDDAAAAVAWAFKNIQHYGGDPNLIFVSGHSAGGYLASMVGLDKRWLAKYDVDANKIAALLPLSGHTITHFTVRKERGIPGTQPIVDEFAPLYHVRPDAAPLVLITGDRDLEMLGRYEENAYLWRMMKVAGHQHTLLYEIQGFNHGEMVNPACSIILKHINEILSTSKN